MSLAQMSPAAARRAGALVLIALSSAQAAPLIIDGQPVAWPDAAWPLPLSDSGLAWRRAAAEWTAGEAAFSPVAQAPVAPDGIVTYAEWDAARWADDVGDAALLGFTLITHEDGALQDADVVLNIDRYTFSELPDIRRFHRPTTLAHELGHVLALGHADAAEALMHAAQEPGEVGAIDAASLAALAEVSTCCAQVRRPSVLSASAGVMAFAQVESGDYVRAHGAAVSDLLVNRQGQVDLPVDALAVEVWTSAGQGGVFAVSGRSDRGADAGLIDAGFRAKDGALADAQGPISAPMDRGCAQQTGSGAPQLWILGALLPLLCVWRRR